MKADKTLLIKVKSKTERRTIEDPEVEMITEWNVRRIISVIVIFLLVIILAYYFSQKVDTDADKYTKSISIGNKANIKRPDSIKDTFSEKEKSVAENISQDLKKQSLPKETLVAESIAPVSPVKQADKEIKASSVAGEQAKQTQPSKTEYLNPHITRARLALGVNKHEPYGKVDLPILVGNTKAEGFYYFTEVSNMKGRTVFHEWLREGKTIYKRKFVIRGKKSRMTTSKLFTYRTAGQWQVRIITKQGELLHKINFSVVRR
ncbi:MAG: DUF2914 domain-containing protein [Methyloprofundus sp.]|nr:DUF2914 domain-containing protein [Methyloprofundus sp.]